MILNKLTIGDKEIFDKYLKLEPHNLSTMPSPIFISGINFLIYAGQL